MAEPKPLPGNDHEPEKEVESIPSGVEVRILLFDFLVLIYAFKVPGSPACTIATYRKGERRRRSVP